MRHYIMLTFLLVTLLFFTTGCQLAQSGFARIAGNARGEFSAAANTLSNALNYSTGQSEQSLAKTILRWIPGSGYKKIGSGEDTQNIKQAPYTHLDKAHMVRIEELFGSKIVTHEGKRVGHVFDLQVSRGPQYEVISIVYGRFALLYCMHVLHPFAQMLHLSGEPETVAWSQVATFEHRTVTLKEGNVRLH